MCDLFCQKLTSIAEQEQGQGEKRIVAVNTLKESHSVKISGKRPFFTRILKDLEAGKYDGILTWHPDRLARNSLEAGMIVDMVDSGKIKDLKSPTLESLHFTKKDVLRIQNSLTEYINIRHNELIEEKLRITAAVKVKKRRQGELYKLS